VIDGTRTRLSVGHGHRARLFALDHHGRDEVHPDGVAPSSAGYRPAILLLNYGWKWFDSAAQRAASLTTGGSTRPRSARPRLS
jgi:hypothetical protein